MLPKIFLEEYEFDEEEFNMINEMITHFYVHMFDEVTIHKESVCFFNEGDEEGVIYIHWYDLCLLHLSRSVYNMLDDRDDIMYDTFKCALMKSDNYIVFLYNEFNSIK